jgi:hypothetical protein
MVIHAVSLVAFQVHPVVVVTRTLPVVAAAVVERVAGEIE